MVPQITEFQFKRGNYWLTEPVEGYLIRLTYSCRPKLMLDVATKSVMAKANWYPIERRGGERGREIELSRALCWHISEASRAYLSSSRRPTICCLLPVLGSNSKTSWQLIYDATLWSGFGLVGSGRASVWSKLVWPGLVWASQVGSVLASLGTHKILKESEN